VFDVYYAFLVLSAIVILTAVEKSLTLGSCKCSARAYSLSCSLYSFMRLQGRSRAFHMGSSI